MQLLSHLAIPFLLFLFAVVRLQLLPQPLGPCSTRAAIHTLIVSYAALDREVCEICASRHETYSGPELVTEFTSVVGSDPVPATQLAALHPHIRALAVQDFARLHSPVLSDLPQYDKLVLNFPCFAQVSSSLKKEGGSKQRSSVAFRKDKPRTSIASVGETTRLRSGTVSGVSTRALFVQQMISSGSPPPLFIAAPGIE